MTVRRFIIAGEASGDTLAAELMQAVDQLAGPAEWHGLGGPKMQAQGLISNQDYAQLSVIGFGDSLTALPRLNRLAHQLADQVTEQRPSSVFTVDSKGFSIRFANILRKKMKKKQMESPLVHLVAPTVWAWGKWRAGKFEQAFDALLCLFPFEPKYFDHNQLACAFVGHPAGFEAAGDRAGGDVRDRNLIALLPGSRRSELDYILEDMLGAAQLLYQDNPARRFLLPCLPHLSDRLADRLAKSDLPIELLQGEQASRTAFARAAAGIIASGTATLQAALAGLPAVCCYRVGPINYRIMRHLFQLEDPVLPHILLGRPVYPYFEQQAQTPANLAAAMRDILSNQDDRAKQMQIVQKQLRDLLTGQAADFRSSLISGLAASGLQL